MHRRRVSAKGLADVGALTRAARRGVVSWLEEDAPQSPKTEPFDPKKCRPEPNLLPDTFTHHAGDLRGVTWVQQGAIRGSADCLWLLTIDEHDDAYAKGCRRAFDGELYPSNEKPDEFTTRLEDADEHVFAETFARATADLVAKGIEGAATVEVGGYYATLELMPGSPNMWVIGFRRTKATDKPRHPRWLNDSEVRALIELLFENVNMDMPDVTYNMLEFPIYAGRPRTAKEWLTAVARDTIGV